MSQQKILTQQKLGNWIFDPALNRFSTRQGEEFFIETRLKKLLLFLLLHKNTIVKRADIIDYVWKEVAVNEESLTKAVFDLRKLLKEKGISALHIETIKHVGYRATLSESPKAQQRPMKWAIKAGLYLLAGSAFLVILIRAMRYTQ